MRRLLLLLVLAVPLPVPAGNADGLVKKASPHGVGETLDRLEKVLTGKGITVALRWRHGERAARPRALTCP